MDLYWFASEDGKHEELYCGCSDVRLASISKCNKWWEGFIWMDGISPDKTYAPYAQMKADIEDRLRRFFELSNTNRPAMDSNDAA